MLTKLIRSIIEKVQAIINSKSNIRASIINKEVEVPEDAKLSEMPGYIDQILNDGIDTTDATATEDKLLDGETAYVNDEKIVGTMPNNGSATLTASIGNFPNIPKGYHDGTGKAQVVTQEKEVSPTSSVQEIVPDEGKVLSKVKVKAMTAGALSADEISISSSGVITAKAKVSTAGYLASGKSVTKTKTLPTVSGKTVTPSTSNKLVAENGTYTTGDIYVEGDPDLKASNIKSGVSIFGVNGSYSANPRISDLGSKTFYFDENTLCNGINLATKNLVALYFCKKDSITWDTSDGLSNFVLSSVFLDIVNETLIYNKAAEYGTESEYDSNPTITVSSNAVEFLSSIVPRYDMSDMGAYYVIAIYSE